MTVSLVVKKLLGLIRSHLFILISASFLGKKKIPHYTFLKYLYIFKEVKRMYYFYNHKNIKNIILFHLKKNEQYYFLKG